MEERVGLGFSGEIVTSKGFLMNMEKGVLEDPSSLIADIQNVKPTRIFNALRVPGRPNVDWCESH